MNYAFLTTAAVAAAFTAAAPAAAAPLELGWQDQRAAMDADLAPAAFTVAHQLGARRMRLVVRWADVQPDPASWHWEAYDAAVDRARQQGDPVQLVLGGIGQRPPAWTGHDNDDPDGFGSWRLMSDRAYLRFAAGAAAHFRGRVDRWSLLNEVDLTGYPAARYGRLFRKARAAIRRWAPGTSVLWGEFSPHAPVTYTNGALVGARADRHGITADGFAVHPYDDQTTAIEGEVTALPGIYAWLRGYGLDGALHLPHDGGRLPIYATEYGCDVATPNCGFLWRRAILTLRRVHARELVAYQLLTDEDQGVKWNTSLTRADGTARPAMAAIAAARAN